MAYSPGEQHPGTNSSHSKASDTVRASSRSGSSVGESRLLLWSSAPGVSGSPVPTGNGSGSILLNFDSEEQTGPSGVGQQHQRLQQHGT